MRALRFCDMSQGRDAAQNVTVTVPVVAGRRSGWRPGALKFLLLSLVLTLTGCSSTTFFYNRLDFILPWYLGRYVDLTSEQSDWFDGQVDDLLAWHRSEELPRYIAILESMEQDLDTTLTLERLQEQSDVLEEAWYRLRAPALEILLELGARLDDEQIDEFIVSLNKRQRKYERKYLRRSDEEFREDATDNIEDFLSDFMGRLTSDQRDRIERTVADLTRSDATWLKERAEWIAVMECLLERGPGWQNEIRTTIQEWEDELDADAMAIYDRNTLLVQELTVEMVNQRTERQDRRLRRRLASLREDLESLTDAVEP